MCIGGRGGADQNEYCENPPGSPSESLLNRMRTLSRKDGGIKKVAAKLYCNMGNQPASKIETPRFQSPPQKKSSPFLGFWKYCLLGELPYLEAGSEPNGRWDGGKDLVEEFDAVGGAVDVGDQLPAGPSLPTPPPPDGRSPGVRYPEIQWGKKHATRNRVEEEQNMGIDPPCLCVCLFV